MRRPRRAPTNDLGFGTQVATGRGQRLLSRDGRFTVRRRGRGPRALLSLYQRLLTVSWPAFLGLVCAAFALVHVAFGLVYAALGDEALSGPGSGFERAFFFSVHTFSGTGYGHVWPRSLGANAVASIEIIAGLVSLGLGAGLSFARLSRPTADIVFSRDAIIAPYDGASSGRALMIRCANHRHSQMVAVRARLIFSSVDPDGGAQRRRFHPLTLERAEIPLFPLSWTIVHPIDEESPLAEMDADALARVGAEVLVLLEGNDELFAQVVHARTSYVAGEIRHGVRFADAFERDADGMPTGIDLRRIHATEPA